MRKATKIALAAGALALAGAAGVSTLASADSRGHHGPRQMSGHHGGGHHGGWQRGRGQRWKMAMLMERFDTNGDGKLTQDEVDEARKTLLAKYDSDKDGKLTLTEYEGLWLEVKRRRMVRSFQFTDLDGDASITVEEFLKPYGKIVERLDRNEDGAIDREDRRRHRGRGMDEGERRGG